MKGKCEEEPNPNTSLFHLNGTYLRSGCDKHKIKAENMPESKENVFINRKNIFVNRMSCPNVESLSRTEDNFIFFKDLLHVCVVIAQQLFDVYL